MPKLWGFYSTLFSYPNIWRPFYCHLIYVLLPNNCSESSILFKIVVWFGLRYKPFTYLFNVDEKTKKWLLERKCAFNWLHSTHRIEIVSDATMSQCLRNTFLSPQNGYIFHSLMLTQISLGLWLNLNFNGIWQWHHSSKWSGQLFAMHGTTRGADMQGKMVDVWMSEIVKIVRFSI